jgi:crossover junction endodeoxyribonuclease RuvC
MTEPAERILGFDPGLQRTGYAVIERCGWSRPTIIEAGVIRLSASKTLAERLTQLHESAVELVREHGPKTVAVEELYSHYERPKTAILMGHARGVLLLAAAQSGLAVSSYMPTQVKKVMTGSGRASKEQMQLAVQAEFGLPHPPEPADVADALAIALCHLYNYRQAG